MPYRLIHAPAREIERLRLLLRTIRHRAWIRPRMIDPCWLLVDDALTRQPWRYRGIGWQSDKYDLHRLSYWLFRGRFHPDLLVCHRCDVPGCFSPNHLFLGTPKDNAQDRSVKGRHRIDHEPILTPAEAAALEVMRPGAGEFVRRI